MLFKTLEKELSGHVEKAALFLLGMKLKPCKEVAKLIKAACRGQVRKLNCTRGNCASSSISLTHIIVIAALYRIGINELLLTSALIRYQEIMRDVMTAHIELFGKTVRDRINSECK